MKTLTSAKIFGKIKNGRAQVEAVEFVKHLRAWANIENTSKE